jgi:hypothetical protein
VDKTQDRSDPSSDLPICPAWPHTSHNRGFPLRLKTSLPTDMLSVTKFAMNLVSFMRQQTLCQALMGASTSGTLGTLCEIPKNYLQGEDNNA